MIAWLRAPAEDERALFAVRTALAVASVVYGFARFGMAAGLRVAAVAGLFVVLDAVQNYPAMRDSSLRRGPLIILQVAAIYALFFAPAPVGFGTDVPAPIMLESPLFLLMFCLLASHISARRPAMALWAGGAIAAGWTVARWIALADPQVVVAADIKVARYHSMLALLNAINTPHYFNAALWRLNLFFAAYATAVVAFAAYRVHLLARRTARQIALRDALAAHFSPQVVDLLTSAKAAQQWSREIAVLDCDLVGFTALAEKSTPEQAAATLGRYRSLVESAVFGADGAILSYAGDGIVAVFGLSDGASPAGAALSCAQALLRQRSGIPPLAMGIDMGPAWAGIAGEGRSASLLMLGPPLEGASELQLLTREAGTPLLVSAAVARTAPQAFSEIDAGGHRVWRPAAEAGAALAAS